MFLYQKPAQNNCLKPIQFNTAISKNPLNENDPYIYRPVGFRGQIDFIDSNNVLIKGQFAFDGWFYGENGTLFVKITLGDQVISMIPIQAKEASKAQWQQAQQDAIWTADINLKVNIETSNLFNQSINQNILFAIEFQINEQAFINNIGIMYNQEIYLNFLNDLKTNIFQTKFNFYNTYNLIDNSQINLFQGVKIDTINKINELNFLYEKNLVQTTPINIFFPDMENTRIIDFLFTLKGINDLEFILKTLEYEIIKYQKDEIVTYNYKSNAFLNEPLLGDSIIIKNKLHYEYNPVTSKFEVNTSKLANFILEQNEKTILKGKVVLNINGFYHYFLFEKTAIPTKHKFSIEIEKV